MGGPARLARTQARGALNARERAASAKTRQQHLATLVPEAVRRADDRRELFRILVDHGTLFELKREFDRSAITTLARLDGQVVGIIASNPLYSAGAMGPDACAKCTSFIVLCDSFNIPLVFLHDTPGFFVSKAAEARGMPGKIINFVEALALATVPKVAVVVRKSYGMAYGNLAGPGMGGQTLCLPGRSPTSASWRPAWRSTSSPRRPTARTRPCWPRMRSVRRRCGMRCNPSAHPGAPPAWVTWTT